MNTQRDEIEIDILEILYVIKKRLWIIILTAIVAGGATGAVSHYLIVPMYSSTSKLYILTKSTSLTSLADIQIGTSLTQDYMELIQSRPVVKQVINNLKMDISYEDMLKQISINNPSSTRILNIVVTNENPEIAKQIADEFAKVSQIQISSIMQTDPPSIVEFGYANEHPVSPDLIKNTVIGTLLGAFLATAIVVTVYLLDDSVKTADDIEKYLGLNTLTSIPLREETGKGKKRKKTKKATKVKRASSGMYGQYVSQKSSELYGNTKDSTQESSRTSKKTFEGNRASKDNMQEEKKQERRMREESKADSKITTRPAKVRDSKTEAMKKSLSKSGLEISSLEDEDFDI